MRPLWAIIKLTFKTAIRSYIFLLLLAVLITAVILIPNTISGDGTAEGYIQVSLKYNLGVIAFILSLSSIWLSCFVLTADVESYQLHMVVTKPISRLTVWLGKYLGVLLINSVLLLISGLIIYGFILYQLQKQDFSKEELSRLKNEVLVGRRVYLPEKPDINAIVKHEFERRVKIAQQSGQPVPNIQDPAYRKRVFGHLRKAVKGAMSEVPPGSTRPWRYTGLPTQLDQLMYLRYRVYVGKISSKEQRDTRGIWQFRAVPELKNIKKEDKGRPTGPFIVAKTNYPEQIGCGVFNEFAIPPVMSGADGTVFARIVDEKGVAEIAYASFDPERKPVYFQAGDGPKLMVKVSGFFPNYCRAILVIFLKLALLTGMACAISSFLSMPVAIFMLVCYLLIGVLATYLLKSFAQYEDDTLLDTPMPVSLVETLEKRFAEGIMMVVIPMQDFEVSGRLANGELVEASYMFRLFALHLLARGAPFVLLGLILYRKRELALVVRK